MRPPGSFSKISVRMAVSGTLIGVAEPGYPELEFDDLVDSRGPVVSLYYGKSAGLAGAGIDALRGPQVLLDGLVLTGQVPSRLEDQFTRHVMAQELGLVYSQYGDLSAPDLGVLLRGRLGRHCPRSGMEPALTANSRIGRISV